MFLSLLMQERKDFMHVWIESRNREYSSVTWFRAEVVSSEASGTGCWYLGCATGLDGK